MQYYAEISFIIVLIGGVFIMILINMIYRSFSNCIAVVYTTAFYIFASLWQNKKIYLRM